MRDKSPIVDKELIRELADLLSETGLTEIEVERGDTRVRIARAPAAAAVHVAAPVHAPPPAAPLVMPESPSEPPDIASLAGTVVSPMVGTAYRASEPGGRPYVDVGEKVREGQTLLIIEAMKTMNQIPSPRAGTVTRILVEDGQPVEYGEPLMIVE
jgi:acetyl-CoA carboxylase biotin carboxyl carrier protein